MAIFGPNQRGQAIGIRALSIRENQHVSIIRIGLAETKGFGQGYEDIFGKAKKPAKAPRAGKKKAANKKAKKK